MVVELLVKEIMVVQKLEDQGLIKYRKAQCDICEFRRNGSCTVCRCLIDVKVESYTNRTLDRFGLPRGPKEKTHCPKGFWGDKETANFYREQKGLDLLQ